MTTNNKTTFHYQCFPVDEVPASLDPDHWRGWLNCKSDDADCQLAAMAANRFIRERGGFDGDSFTVAVFCYWNTAPRYKNGGPMAVSRFDIKFTPNRKAVPA